MAGRAPRSLALAAALSALVAAGALVGAAAVGSSSGVPPDAGGDRSSQVGTPGAAECQAETCQVLASVSIAGTTVELLVDAGGGSGRLRIGGASTGQMVETIVMEMGVTLTVDSLQCVAGGPAACLVRGAHAEGTAGQVVVGRSGSWRALKKPYVSDAGYLALANVDDDSAPEVVAAQHDCAGAADCSRQPVLAQVYELDGSMLGCTKSYPRVDRLPGYPQVRPTKSQLGPC